MSVAIWFLGLDMPLRRLTQWPPDGEHAKWSLSRACAVQRSSNQRRGQWGRAYVRRATPCTI